MSGYEELVSQMKEKFTSLAGYSPDDASDIGIRIRVLAGEIYTLNSAVDWLKMQAFPQTAQGQQLDLHAQERGIARKPAIAAQGTLTFGRSTPLWYNAAIPAGTVCATAGENPVSYHTTREATLPQGQFSVSVPAMAEIGGRNGNAQPGTVTVMVTPPPAIETVTNDSAFSGGEDREGDSELRARLMQNCAQVSNGTNAAFYREFALGYDGVQSAGVIPREHGVGTVGVYLGAQGSVASQQIVDTVQKDLNSVKEINVDVSVKAAQGVPVSVTVGITPADRVSFEEAKAACENAIDSYFNTLSVGESFVVAALGVSLLGTGKIKNYCFSSAATFDLKITQSQLAVCSSVSILPYAGV